MTHRALTQRLSSSADVSPTGSQMPRLGHSKTLNEKQLDVLCWIADGCPDGIMVAYAHRVSAESYVVCHAAHTHTAMTSAALTLIVPSRSRPESVGRVVEAWETTGGFTDAVMHWVIDADDPGLSGYVHRLEWARERNPGGVEWTVAPFWMSLVPKLNAKAVDLACGDVEALGFAGDDHLPRTPGWAARHLAALRELGTGIVYCDDGYQHQALPTQWVMTVDIVRELKAMVPAAVEHLYCDNAVMDLGVAAGCLTYLPDVLIEHMNPYARKGTLDAQYQRVNSRAQYARDRPAYAAWRAEHLPGQAAAVRRLRTAQ